MFLDGDGPPISIEKTWVKCVQKYRMWDAFVEKNKFFDLDIFFFNFRNDLMKMVNGSENERTRNFGQTSEQF